MVQVVVVVLYRPCAGVYQLGLVAVSVVCHYYICTCGFYGVGLALVVVFVLNIYAVF